MVKEIADRLELDFGVPHFLDAFAIPTGEAFRPWIEQALLESSGCAIFLGKNGWGPTHNWEAERALERHAVDADFRLIPVVLAGVTTADMTVLGDGSLFRDINWADLRNGPEDQDALDKLYAALTGQTLQTLPQGRGPARLTPYQVRRDAARWQRAKQRGDGILYRGVQLEEAERLMKAIPDLATVEEITPFLLASAARQRKIWRRLVIAITTVTVVIAGLGIAAERLREIAEERRALAASRELALESRAEPAPAISLLLAAQAYSEARTPEAAGNLLERLANWPRLARILHSNIGALSRVAWDAKSGAVAAGTIRGSLLRWSSDSFSSVYKPLRASTGAIRSIAIDQDRGETWVGYEDGRVLVWSGAGKSTTVAGIPTGVDISQIADVNTLQVGPPIGSIALSSDGSIAAVGTAAGTGAGSIFLIDRKQKAVLGAGISIDVPRVNALDFDQVSGRLVAGTGFGKVVVIDPRTRTLSTLPDVKMSEILTARFAADGAIVAVDDVGQVAIWAPEGKQFRLRTSFTTTDYLTAASARPDGAMLALGDGRGIVHLINIASQDQFSSFQAHTGNVTGLDWDAQSRRLASAGADGTVDVWDLNQISAIATSLGQLPPTVLALRALSGGQLVAGRASVGSAGLWRRDKDQWTLTADLLQMSNKALGGQRFESDLPHKDTKDGFVPVPTPEIDLLEFDDDGSRVAWATRDGAVLSAELNGDNNVSVIWDGTVRHEGSVQALRLSHSGRYLAIAYTNHRVLLCDLTAPASNRLKEIPMPDAVRSLGFNRAETLLATGFEDGDVALWSMPGGANVTPATRIHSVAAGNVTFSLAGTTLVSHAVVGDGNEPALNVLPVPKLNPAHQLIAHATGRPPAIVAVDDPLLAAADEDGRVFLWDFERLVPEGSLRPSDSQLDAMTFNVSQGLLLTADRDGYMVSWQLGGAQWQAAACKIANRPLSPEEWSQFVGSEPYSPSCRVDSKRR